ncbi:WXG100 family type VII secretion target [Streptosporangium roseum]|uniref:WXG100 family type VII secretion target n=1 Tax=Streptosporangium roseum TaxID=2001 RepID=UPI00331D6EFA
MTREPQPTLQDEWSAWEPYPQRQHYWPGLGVERVDEYEANHARLQAIGTHFMTEFEGVYQRLPKPQLDDFADRMGYHPTGWGAAQTWTTLVGAFEDALCFLTTDAMMETAVAARGVATSGRTYELVDKDSWLSKHPVGGGVISDRAGRYRVTNAYPSGSIGLLTPYENVDNVIGNWVANEPWMGDDSRAYIRHKLMSWKPEGLTSFANTVTGIANGLVEVAHGLMSRAQEMRDAPWRGAAADHAQQSLRQIYENVRGLAATHGQVAQGLTAAAEIITTAQSRFDVVVNKGGWEFSDLWHGDDEDARHFLKGVGQQLADVLRQMPQTARIHLPGLIPEAERATYSLAG